MKLFKKKKETTQQWLAKKHTYNHSYYKNRKLWLINTTCHPDEEKFQTERKYGIFLNHQRLWCLSAIIPSIIFTIFITIINFNDYNNGKLVGFFTHGNHFYNLIEGTFSFFFALSFILFEQLFLIDAIIANIKEFIHASFKDKIIKLILYSPLLITIIIYIILLLFMLLKYFS